MKSELELPLGLPTDGAVTVRPAALKRSPAGERLSMAAVLGSGGLLYFGFVTQLSLGARTLGWLAIAAILLFALAVLANPLPVFAVRYSLPLILFVAWLGLSLGWSPAADRGLPLVVQMVALPLAYVSCLVAFSYDPDLFWRFRTLVVSASPLVLLLFVVGISAGQTLTFFRGGFARPVAMSVVMVFIFAAEGLDRRKAWFAWLLALTVLVLLGGRTSIGVLLVLPLITPSLRVPVRWRLVLAGFFAALVLAGLATPAVRDRMFYGQVGSVSDIVSGRFNTAGRTVIFPYLLRSCSSQQPLGAGAGSSYEFTEMATQGNVTQPHNEYLRWFCDAGIVGSFLIWGFFLAAGWRALSVYRRDGPFGSVALQAVTAMLLFALTTNPITNLRWFAIPVLVAVAASDSVYRSTAMRSGERNRRLA